MSLPEGKAGRRCVVGWKALYEVGVLLYLQKAREGADGAGEKKSGGKRERKPGVTHPGPGGPDVSEGRVTWAVPRAAENAGAERAG